MRKFIKLDERHFGAFWPQLLLWLNGQQNFIYLNSNNFKFNRYSPAFKQMAAVGGTNAIKGTGEGDFDNLKNFLDAEKDWAFGFFTYDLKNQVEKTKSGNADYIGMPDLYFFNPALLFIQDDEGLKLGYESGLYSEDNIIFILDEIKNATSKSNTTHAPLILGRVDKPAYIENIGKIKEHIQYGDVYEINYCIEHYAENADINPVEVYQKLVRNNPAPFSSFCKVDGKYLISASPERFLKKTGDTVISQPMKGTIRRGQNTEEDEALKTELAESEKDRAENVMIVDLVRNDLSKTAKPASVEVEELFGIYTFPQVHQMISTVKAEVKENIHPIDVIKSAFPMGSMTGAPKVRAMELIEEYEETKRGLFSGSIGYFTPEGDFDFNVVIRSILFNSENKYLSFITGGAITINSDPKQEYDECLLKAKALKEALS